MNKNDGGREQKLGKMFGCWLLYHYWGYFCQLPWPGCAFPPLLAPQLFIFPMDQFSLCTKCLAMHKSRQINFVKTENVNNLTQWMAAVAQLSSHYCVLSEDIYQRDQTIDQWHRGDKKCWCRNQLDVEADQGMFSSFWPPLRLSEHNKAIITRS